MILKWAYNLCRDTGWDLLDGHAKHVNEHKVRTIIESLGSELIDLHIWRVSPHAIACEVVLESKEHRRPEVFRAQLKKELGLHQVVIEERVAG